MGRDTFFGRNIVGQQEWELRGTSDAQLRAMESRATLLEGRTTILEEDNFTIFTDFGAWTAYTPALTNVTLGNGTLIGRYQRFGRKVTATVSFTLGTTSDITSFCYFGLPFQEYNPGGAPGFVGACWGQDASTAFRATGVVSTSSSSVFPMLGGSGGALHVSNTWPWDWTTSDYIAFTITYEASS